MKWGHSSKSGIDAEANYRFDMGGVGSLGLQFIGTYVDEFLTEPLPGADKYDCSGLFGTVCGTPVRTPAPLCSATAIRSRRCTTRSAVMSSSG